MTTKDSLSVLRSFGPVLTKVWRADGSIESYGRAKHFQVEERGVDGVESLAAALQELERDPRSCVIRGKPRSGTDLEKTTRDLESFEDVPRRWLCLDVDDWDAMLHGVDPIADPEAAVSKFIAAELPEEFQNVSCFWQLSASAGTAGKAHLLKVHLWFWLRRPAAGEALERWARALHLRVDPTVFRTVQVHYTSAPVIEDGASCPVGQRSGLLRGLFDDTVDLVIPDELEAPRERKARDELADPRSKPGLIGAFCRAYPPQRAVDDLLVGVFEWEDGDDRRLTWLRSGSGATGGAVITDDGQRVYNAHATDPAEGRACNIWDLCLHHLFDGDEDRMRAFAKSLPDVLAELPTRTAQAADDWDEFDDDPEPLPPGEAAPQVAPQADPQEPHKPRAEEALRRNYATAEEQVEDLRKGVARCDSVADLKAYCAAHIRGDESIENSDRHGILVPAVQKRWTELTGNRLRAVDARELVGEKRAAPAAAAAAAAQAPSWIQRWVRLINDKAFLNLDDKQLYGGEDFDIAAADHMPVSQDGVTKELASNWVRRGVLPIQQVLSAVYAPGKPEVFEFGKNLFANSYDPDSAPQASPGDGSVARMVEAHLRRLFPDDRERELLVSWMAHQVLYPGRKVRWAPYIWGVEGSGKTFLHDLLALAMGHPNVKIVSGSTLKSDFTGWATGAAVITLEEVYQVGHAADLLEKLKVPLSNDMIDVHRKGKDNYQAPNYSNYLLLSNHADGLPVGESDRRFMFLAAAVTTEEARELSETGYFRDLFDTVKAAPGEVRHWLLNVPMHAEFDPSGRAPLTKARTRAIEAVRGDAELTLADAIGDGQAFFADWARGLLEKHRVDPPKGRGWNALVTRLGFLPDSIKARTGARSDGKTTRVYRRPSAESWTSEQLRSEAARVRARASEETWDDDE